MACCTPSVRCWARSVAFLPLQPPVTRGALPSPHTHPNLPCTHSSHLFSSSLMFLSAPLALYQMLPLVLMFSSNISCWYWCFTSATAYWSIHWDLLSCCPHSYSSISKLTSRCLHWVVQLLLACCWNALLAMAHSLNLWSSKARSLAWVLIVGCSWCTWRPGSTWRKYMFPGVGEIAWPNGILAPLGWWHAATCFSWLAAKVVIQEQEVSLKPTVFNWTCKVGKGGKVGELGDIHQQRRESPATIMHEPREMGREEQLRILLRLRPLGCVWVRQKKTAAWRWREYFHMLWQHGMGCPQYVFFVLWWLMIFAARSFDRLV